MIRYILSVLLVWFTLSQNSAAAQWVAGLQLIPDTAQGVVEIPNVPALRASFEKTGLGRLLETPEMEKAAEAFGKTIDGYLCEQGGSVSLDLDDLLKATSGELLVTWIRANEPRHPYRVAILADARGEEEKANALLKSISDELTKRGGKSKPATIGGASVTVFTLPIKVGKLDVDQAVLGSWAVG